MAQQTINHGSAAGDGTGESLFNAFQKTNANDAELFGAKTEVAANFAALPATGVAGKIYITLDDDAMYRWTGTGYDDLGGMQFAASFAALPATGEALKIYATLDKGILYRWSGSAYVAMTFGVGADANGSPILAGVDGNSYAIGFKKYNILNNGAKADGIVVYDAGLTASTKIMTSASNPFKPTDVGKMFYIHNGLSTRSAFLYGVITGYAGAGSVTVDSNPIGGAITNGVLIFGTNDLVAIEAAIARVSAAGGGTVEFPNGITMSRSADFGTVNVPKGVHIAGHGTAKTSSHSGALEYNGGCTWVSIAPVGTSVTLGTGTIPRRTGSSIQGIFIDGGPASNVVNSTTFESEVKDCQLAGQNIAAGGLSGIYDSYLMSSHAGVTIRCNGDSRVHNNWIMGGGSGAGTTNSTIYTNGADDISIMGNHIIVGDAGFANNSRSILVLTNGTSKSKGGILIANNKFDSSEGEHIEVIARDTSTMRCINIVGNIGMQEDGVPNDTYPAIRLISDVGASIDGLNIQGNNFRSSWNDPLKGTYKHFFDVSGLLGTNRAGNISNNACSGVALTRNIYSSGVTPAGVLSVNNTIVRTDGVVVTG